MLQGGTRAGGRFRKPARIIGITGMGKALIKKKKRMGRYKQWLLGGISVLFVFVCYQNMASLGNAPALWQFVNFGREEIAVSAWKNCMMAMLCEQEEDAFTLESFLMQKIRAFYPIYAFSETIADYDTQIESDLSVGMEAENEGQSRKNREEGQKEEAGTQTKGQEKEKESKEGKGKKEKAGKDKTAKDKNAKGQETVAKAGEAPKSDKAAEIPREKLNDFDYLIQNFYQVDRTTTIDSSELNAQEMLAKDMKIQGGSENAQILIYHTHSQEGYADSAPGDAGTSVVAVGERLAQLLTEQYGFHVLHHTGEYDVEDRDNAYSYAGPALEQVLAENPSIEVVIDLHRDGVAETTRLVSEVNGKQTAQIMFFNGLSRTTSNGNIAYLANPNLADNLAFSFQLKLAAEEYYPGFARATYLKGYRYNLHYRPRSLLVEVGAQTNTFEEAMNAMEPLADILHRVLAP